MSHEIKYEKGMIVSLHDVPNEAKHLFGDTQQYYWNHPYNEIVSGGPYFKIYKNITIIFIDDGSIVLSFN